MALAATVLATAACSHTPPTTVDGLGGRLAVQVAATAQSAARQFSSGFELRGDARRGELDLTTPLGTVLARARWEPGRAEWTGPEGRQDAADLDTLAEQAFGERLPMAALFDWLRGRPWPQEPHAPHALGFEQLGWVVDLQGWAEHRVVARRIAPPAVTVRALLEPRS